MYLLYAITFHLKLLDLTWTTIWFYIIFNSLILFCRQKRNRCVGDRLLRLPEKTPMNKKNMTRLGSSLALASTALYHTQLTCLKVNRGPTLHLCTTKPWKVTQNSSATTWYANTGNGEKKVAGHFPEYSNLTSEMTGILPIMHKNAHQLPCKVLYK